MRKLLFSILVFTFAVCASVNTFSVNAGSGNTAMPSPNIVISQFQTGGSASSNDEFIELHNAGPQPFDLNGHKLVYRSAAGVNDVLFAEWTTSIVIPAGGFFLIASNSYNGPATPDLIYNNTTCSCAMALAGGGLAIRNGAVNTGFVIDSVGYGTASNAFIETTVTTNPAVETGQGRIQNGCQDTDNNQADLANFNPALPRNSGTSPVACTGGGTSMFASLSANPVTVTPGGTILFRVTVTPATTPPSTNIAVVGNLQSIGGASNQSFFDDGTNGDTTPGDNIFSYLATVPAETSGGVKLIVAVAADAQMRSVVMQQNITVNAPLPNEDPLIFGNPSGATTDVGNSNNYLMVKPQYSLSYDRSENTPNWVAWRLDSSWIGSFNDGSFAPDTALPSGWYQVLPEDYSEPVYDRGHMCPAGDRTNSQANNSATYLMTNIVPQHPDNNQGAWNDFENYCRTLASQGNEIYIITGPAGNIGTIGSTQQNRVVVPSHTWKVVLILPNGSNDLQRVTRSTRAFGIIMANLPQNRNTGWRPHRVTVDAVEYLTGYDFFSAVPKITQELIEKRRDIQ